jgi:hypothetical protein
MDRIYIELTAMEDAKEYFEAMLKFWKNPQKIKKNKKILKKCKKMIVIWSWEVKCIIKGRATTGKVTFFINSLSIRYQFFARA